MQKSKNSKSNTVKSSQPKIVKVRRENFLRDLELVQPGIAKREVIEQSSCFVFQDGYVMTFDDEVFCKQECKIPIEGAIAAEPLMAILGKMKEDELEIEISSKEVRFHGKRKKAGILMESEIVLPVDKIEAPGTWNKLSPKFLDAVALVENSASSDQSKFAITCIHVTAEHVEACDNFQATRMKCKSGFQKSVLFRRDALKHVPGLGMIEFSETENWVHFRNPEGMTLSCRRYQEQYPDLSGILEFDAKESSPIVIPKGLGEAAEKCAVFSSENADDPNVEVTLTAGKLRIKGVGVRGWFQESRKLAYKGADMTFRIDPKMLIELSKNYSDATITSGKLKVVGPKWEYVTCLGVESGDDPTKRKNKNWHGEKGKKQRSEVEGRKKAARESSEA